MKYQRLLPLVLLAMSLHLPAFAQPRAIFGYIEKVHLTKDRIPVKAKLDSGAKTASLNANNIKVSKVKGERWVSFDFVASSGKSHHFKRPLVRIVRIKKRLGRRKSVEDLSNYYERRPVIMMWVCLGKQKRLLEVDLTNRENFMYNMLIGRKGITAFNGLISPKDTFLTTPECRS